MKAKRIKNIKVYSFDTNEQDITYPVIRDMKRFKSVCEKAASTIKEVFKDDKPINLIGTGSSGAFITTMLSVHIPNSSIVYVRKPEDESHGTSLTCEKSLYDLYGHIIFVDDLISTGATLERTINSLKNHYASTEINHIVLLRNDRTPEFSISAITDTLKRTKTLSKLKSIILPST